MLKPLFDRVIVRQDAAEKVTSGGILVPEVAQRKHGYGTVVSVGDGRPSNSGGFVPVGLKEGDRVLFAGTAGTPIRYAEEDFLCLREEDIIGVIE